MAQATLDVPEAVRQKAEALGTEGRQWLHDLPELLADLAAEWEVVVGATLFGGSESYVAATTTREGADLVIKLELPGDASFGTRAGILAAANGHAYVRLLRHDETRRAMLQERLGPRLSTLGFSVEAQIGILYTTLREAWKVPAVVPLDSGADKARRLATFIATTWEELGRPCSERAVEQALAFADTRAAVFDPDASVVVHGDPHNNNALRTPDTKQPAFKLVDPESFLAERAYDLGISMREWSSELLSGDAVVLGRERCALLARASGVAPEAIWEWGFIERVSTGLLTLHVGAESVARDILRVADLWAAAR